MKFSKYVPYILFQLCLNSVNCRADTNYQRDCVNYDLTDTIDNALKTGERSSIETALQKCRGVHYSTDILLDEFQKVLPVVDLIRELSVNGSYTRLTLGLRYVNQSDGRFLAKRVADLYYNLTSQLSPDDAAKIRQYVSAIMLDFRSTHSESTSFYGSSYEYLVGVSFTDVVKNFVALNFGKMYERSYIDVGVLYGNGEETNYNSYRYLKDQMHSADFLVYGMNLNWDLYSGFPIFVEPFFQKLNGKVRLNNLFLNASLPTTHLRRFHWVPVMLNIGKGPVIDPNELYPFYKPNPYWETLERVLSETSHFEATSQQFFRNAMDKSLKIFEKVAVKWAQATGHPLLLRKPLKNNDKNTIKQRGDNNRTSLIIPSLHINESVRVCDIKANLSKLSRGYEAVMADEKSFRTLVRLQKELENTTGECIYDGYNNYRYEYEDYARESPRSKSLRPTNVILNFESGISSVWSDIKDHVVPYIEEYPPTAMMRLTTVLFSNYDINQSKDIQTLLNNIPKKTDLKVGCLVSFMEVLAYFQHTYSQNTTISANSFKESMERAFCSSVFDSVDTFVWKVFDDLDFKYLKMVNAYSNVFLMREIFMKEFPGKNVLIQFPSQVSKVGKEFMAKLHNVPIITEYLTPRPKRTHC